MLKYTTAEVTFREVPDEVTLCINISNCPIHCPDCHSKELWGDIGEELTKSKLCSLIEENKGITCICFLGGDSDIFYLRKLIIYIRSIYKNLRIGWYSGQDELHPIMLCELDYYKYGSYKKEFGGLDCPTTNQKLYVTDRSTGKCKNITYKFWKTDVLK